MNFDVDKLLPHDPPMVLIDRLIQCDETSVVAAVTIKKDSPFFENGSVPAYVSIEYMAQTIALWKGVNDAHLTKPVIGFLLGTRRLILNKFNFDEGTTLHIYGELLCIVEQLASFKCCIKIDDQMVAEATVSVFQPKNAEHSIIL